MSISSRVTEIRVSSDRRQLAVQFGDGVTHALSAESLRVNSPSAEVQGHSPDQRITVSGKRNVAIASVEPVGNYAIKIGFDDGHDTGIYSWSYLRALGDESDTLWTRYLKELEQKGLSRDA
jgi:DUF971 family protein